MSTQHRRHPTVGTVVHNASHGRYHPFQIARIVFDMFMSGLRSLHAGMRATGRPRAIFGYQHGRAELHVIFATDEVPYALYVAAQGVDTVRFKVPVQSSYHLHPYLDKAVYVQLMDVLGIRYNPANPFSPKGFFQTLDDNAPRSINAVRSPRGSEVARHFKPEIEEADKIYFLSWLEHIDDGCHASPENKEKTRLLLGQEFFEMCDRGNISSRWTADRTKERPEIRPPGRRTSHQATSPDPTAHG